MTTGWPSAPVVYEIDTWPWLTEVAGRLGHPVTLAEVPDEVWEETLPPGIDAVWLMGVWERSPAGLVVARANEDLQRSFHEALPGLQPADLVGSPYCVRRYRVDEHLGGPSGLATARAALARRGLRLVLDYVPNHVAPDHPGVVEEPSWFIQGDEADEEKEPVAWFRAAGRILAHGRDPYFPPWPDVAQLNAFSPALRSATAAAMIDIAGQCDGLRCDMAMLLTNEVFARTWGQHAGPRPAEEFWPSIIARLREHRPDVVLIAEAYWDMEWELQQQGFDFCYDKRLYDRLAGGSAAEVRNHLGAGRDYQDRLIRFIENHDEPRAATALPGGRDRAAAVAIATLPGATLWHEGEFEGWRTHLPVFLGRFPDEPVDEDLRAFHHRLLAVVAGMRRGEWTMLDAAGWPDNPTHADVLAWAWHDEIPHHLVAINLSDHPAQARIALPWPALAGRRWRLVDLLDGRTFDRDDLAAEGVYVDLPPWGQHLLAVTPA
jgi:hypothetical protein